MSTYTHAKNTVFHTAIIGAGAGGLFCAGSFNHSKIVLESNPKPALKVSVSGGGKCNFSNLVVSATDYLSQNKHFCKSALAAFKPQDFIQLLNEAHISWEERQNGQLFAFDAQEIVRFLVKRAQKANSEILYNTRVLDIRREKNLFILDTSIGPVQAQHVVLATGGLSFPSLGANGFGVKMAHKFGWDVIEPRPALCGLTLPKEYKTKFSSLAGNSLTAQLSCDKKSFLGQLLFTHDGISGPVVLQTSLFWESDKAIEINFLPTVNVMDFLSSCKNSNQTISAALVQAGLSKKIAKALLGETDRDLANATKTQLLQVAKFINNFTVVPIGTSGYTKAEVTAGGISTREFNASTLESRTQPGLYAIGEVLDVTGRLGGFNLQWAWSSGFTAAKALEKLF
jgi:predicted Rossmann fold flavoprotein